MAGLSSAPQQFASIWRRVDINHKIAIVLAGAGSAAALVALVVWGGRPSYGLLYSNLSQKDAAAVVAQLDGESIPYKLSDGGAAVLVPSDRVQQARARLLMQGVPSGGDGFEILDKSTLGMTSFAERKTYLRAVQGELARTIGHVEPVEWARVHISAPEPSVFLDRDRPATASVLLKLHAGGELSPGQVASITAFVARSVEGLEPKNVTVTDQFLHPLSRAVQGEGPGSATAHIEAQRQIERHLGDKVRQMLEAALGPGRSSVSVCADIQLKQEETRSTTFEEEGRVAKMEKSRTSKTSGGGAAPGGPAGAASNLQGRAAGGRTTSGGSTNSETEETSEFEVPRTETVRLDQGVLIRRLTVSALVAGTHATDKGPDGKETRTFKPLPAEEMTKLSDAVKQAVGFEETRGDVVKVECVEFNEPTPAVTAAEVAGERRWAWMLRLARHGSTVVVVLAFLLVARSWLRRTRAARAAAEAEMREADARAAAAAGGAAAGLRERVASAIASDPDAASELLKAWYKGTSVRQPGEPVGS